MDTPLYIHQMYRQYSNGQNFVHSLINRSDKAYKRKPVITNYHNRSMTKEEFKQTVSFLRAKRSATKGIICFNDSLNNINYITVLCTK